MKRVLVRLLLLGAASFVFTGCANLSSFWAKDHPPVFVMVPGPQYSQLPPVPAGVPPVAANVEPCKDKECVHSHYWCETIGGTPTFGWKAFSDKEEALVSQDSFRADPRFNHLCGVRSPIVAANATGWDVYPPHGYTVPQGR